LVNFVQVSFGHHNYCGGWIDVLGHKNAPKVAGFAPFDLPGTGHSNVKHFDRDVSVTDRDRWWNSGSNQ